MAKGEERFKIPNNDALFNFHELFTTSNMSDISMSWQRNDHIIMTFEWVKKGHLDYVSINSVNYVKIWRLQGGVKKFARNGAKRSSVGSDCIQSSITLFKNRPRSGSHVIEDCFRPAPTALGIRANIFTPLQIHISI